jgi:hypothetical protein
MADGGHVDFHLNFNNFGTITLTKTKFGMLINIKGCNNKTSSMKCHTEFKMADSGHLEFNLEVNNFGII